MDWGRVPYDTSCDSLFEFIPAEGPAIHPCPEALRNRIMIDTVHDGSFIPIEFLLDDCGASIDNSRFLDSYYMERDWGASLMAHYIAGFLGLDGHYRVNVARVLMDFGRFPGVTGRDADHLRRYAINYPFSTWLSFSQKRALLDDYYDTISHTLDAAVRKLLIKIAIHTYDPYNESGTLRPQVSLVNRVVGYQDASELPVGVFDPAYPDVLAEFTADRILLNRISLVLEKQGIPVAHNYPYCLPEGSVEVRAQVWYFFNYLQRRFLSERPETRDEPGYEMVWNMLMDTNLRGLESGMLRSHIHMFRRAPADRAEEFRAARLAYFEVISYLESQPEIVRDYRFSPDRPSSFGIEVRKDLIWEFDGNRPVRPRLDEARRIASTIAEALHVYLAYDREQGRQLQVSA